MHCLSLALKGQLPLKNAIDIIRGSILVKDGASTGKPCNKAVVVPERNMSFVARIGSHRCSRKEFSELYEA